MITLLNVIHIFVCLFLVLVILLQAGKSGGMGGMGGGGGSSTVFGSRGSQTLLGKVTTISATVFMLTSLSLAWFSSRSESMILNQALPTEVAEEPAAPAEEAPAAPAEEAPAAPAEEAAPAEGGQQ